MTPLGGSPTSGPSGTTPPSQPSMQPGAGATSASPGAYPKTGHAPDYSWIAGRVVFTRIQGGCIFIDTRDAADVPTPPPAVATGPIVSTAVAMGTSPPLRDITPVVGPPTVDLSAPQGPVFSPNGAGWDSSAVKDGDYVVAFGHVAGPGDLRQMCPGGTPYIVDRMQPNP
jgi:hypothetical protein